MGADGNLYGTSSTGGPGGHGNVFRLSFTSAPQITTQPAGLSSFVGAAASFSVGVTGSPVLTFQWQKNGTNLTNGNGVAGATNRVLTLTNLVTNNAGNYSVIVSNALASVPSTPAMLTVSSSGPSIVSSPTPLTLLPGATATFSVGASGNAPLYYQWRKNSTNLTDVGNLTGSGTATLTINNVSAADAGTYSAVVSNSLGSAPSGGALLTVVSVTTPGVTLARVYSFSGGSDGADPNGLAQSSNGVFYGTTRNGGSNGMGTLFLMTTNSPPTPLRSFSGLPDGANPQAPLTQGADGNFYGTTYGGGANGLGTIFQVTTNGLFTTMASFGGGLDGAYPAAGLTQGADGNFYGTAFGGGTNFFGTVFRWSPGGAITGLYSFSGGADGGQPQGALALAFGNLYGVTSVGGSNGAGTLFLVSSNGAVSTLHSFDPVLEGSSPNGLVSTYPPSGTNQGGGLGTASIFGSTSGGGANSNGTLFRADLNGGVTNFYSFSRLTNSTNANGANPKAPLFLGSDRLLYGTTANGGLYGMGTVFWASSVPASSNSTGGSNAPSGFVVLPPPAATPMTLAWFDGYDGAHPTAPLMQGMDGYFYGTTSAGGLNNEGVIYRLGAAASPLLASSKTTNGEFTFGWSATTGRIYQVQYTTNLSASNWQNLGSATPATNSIMWTTDPAPADPQRYYRVMLLP